MKLYLKSKRRSEAEMNNQEGYTWPKAVADIFNYICMAWILMSIADCVSGGSVFPW